MAASDADVARSELGSGQRGRTATPSGVPLRVLPARRDSGRWHTDDALAGSPQRPAGKRAGVRPPSTTTTPLTITYGMPSGQPPRILVGRRVADRLGVDAVDVGGHAGPQQPPVGEAEPLRGQRRHLPHRLLPA